MYAYQSQLQPHYSSSGIGERCWLAPVRWFAQPYGIPVPVPPFTGPGDSVRILTDHQWAHPDFGFVAMQLAPEKNMLSMRSIGGRETQKFEHTLNVFFAGSTAVLHETLSQMINEPFIALARDSTCEGKMIYQLGNRKSWLWLQADWESGTSAEGDKGYNCRFRWIGPSAYIFQGTPVTLPEDPHFDPAHFLFTDFKTI